MESHTQGGAFAYPGLNYSALSGLNTLILKHFRTLQSCMRPVSYLSAYGAAPPTPPRSYAAHNLDAPRGGPSATPAGAPSARPHALARVAEILGGAGETFPRAVWGY